ncbi:uncharacterized protein si:ch211-113e8.11 [Silurus meridionalis]|uniref:C3H1-type domain-containing protein n=1 Tax=Silurus meridionalis TaxID=175797 RepID=A0A8T0BSN1_SILME|nr:uncharacterized protein si:ch211-113e8.11 [Silurus meridionalis]KAF7710044.1 hypothetical protein HF521_008916 [Silurus meridionalis]
MNSLVGYGDSSESEEEAEIQSGTSKDEENSDQKKSHNFLLECGSASSESSSDCEDEKEQELELRRASVSIQSSPEDTVPPAVTPASKKLPPPALGRFCAPAGGSVFTNPFKEQVERKISALQKHVPLTAHARPTHIGGKKVCVAYRKNGRCRFGIRCKFAHDSDLQQSVAEPSVQVSDSNSTATHTPACRDLAVEREREDKEENQSRRKKHRVGVCDSLIPPKRAMKQYAMQSASHTHTRT